MQFVKFEKFLGDRELNPDTLIMVLHIYHFDDMGLRGIKILLSFVKGYILTLLIDVSLFDSGFCLDKLIWTVGHSRVVRSHC